MFSNVFINNVMFKPFGSNPAVLKMWSRFWGLLVLLAFSIAVEAAYEDARCKCVCVDHSVPKTSNGSSTEPKRSVYVKSIPSDKW